MQEYIQVMTEERMNKLISRCESAIEGLKLQQQQMLPDLETSKQLMEEAMLEYQKHQKAYDEIQKEVEEEQAIIRQLVIFKTNDHKEKRIRVFQNISNTNHKVQSRKKRIPYASCFQSVLKATDKFLSSSEILSIAKQKYPELSSANEQTIYNFEWRVKNEQVHSLAWYNDKIGLSEWVANGRPREKYIKNFMG